MFKEIHVLKKVMDFTEQPTKTNEKEEEDSFFGTMIFR